MSTRQPTNGIPTSGSLLPEVNLLEKSDTDQIWQFLFNQQVRHGPHPRDHPSVMRRLQKDHWRIVLTVNWTIRKLGIGLVPQLTTADVHNVFRDTASGEPLPLSKKILRWVQNRWKSMLGWATAVGIGTFAFIAINRPVLVHAPPALKPVVIERERIPTVIHFWQEGSKTFAWEGTDTPTSGAGRWVEVQFKKTVP